MEQTNSSYLGEITEITEIIEKIKTRTRYKTDQEEAAYENEYKKKQYEYILQHEKGVQDTGPHDTFERDKYRIIKKTHTPEQNEEFLIFLKDVNLIPKIKKFIATYENKIENIKDFLNKNPSRLQRLFSFVTLMKNNKTKQDEKKEQEKEELIKFKAELYKIQDKVIPKLIEIYKEEVKGGKYKTRRNINKKYKKSVKKYKNSYRRR